MDRQNRACADGWNTVRAKHNHRVKRHGGQTVGYMYFRRCSPEFWQTLGANDAKHIPEQFSANADSASISQCTRLTDGIHFHLLTLCERLSARTYSRNSFVSAKRLQTK
jgi:hypothetical protein